MCGEEIQELARQKWETWLTTRLMDDGGARSSAGLTPSVTFHPSVKNNAQLEQKTKRFLPPRLLNMEQNLFVKNNYNQL